MKYMKIECPLFTFLCQNIIRVKISIEIGVEISNELGQSLPRLQIYPNFVQNSEPEFLAER